MTLREAHVAEVQIGWDGARIQIDGGVESPDGLAVVLASHGLEADLVLEKRENRLVLRFAVRQLRQPLPRVVRIAPLVLFLVEFLKIHERVAVVGIEPQDLVERLEGAVDESAALVIETDAEQHVRVLELAQIRPLQQSLMNGDRLADLSLFPVQIAQDHMDLEGVGVHAGRAAQFFDGQIDLVRDQKVQTEDVVRRSTGAPAVDPLAAAQLVSLPRLADRQTGQQGDQGGKKGRVRAHGLTMPAGAA